MMKGRLERDYVRECKGGRKRVKVVDMIYGLK